MDMIKKGKYIAVRPSSIIEARYSLNATQNDIIDMVLHKIDDDENYLYELVVDDYKDFYRTDTSNIYRDIKKATKSLEGAGFYLLVKNEKGIDEEIFFSWFASIHYKDKEGKIIFEIGTKLKKLLIEIKKIYYKIEYPINFKSIYSKRIYYYLKSFEDTGWRLDKLDDLRHKLNCPSSYEKYSFFKNKVLDIAYDEINNYSDINFEFKPITEGRKVTKIYFSIKNEKLEQLKNKQIIDDEIVKQMKEIMSKHPIDDNEAMAIYKSSEGNFEHIKKVYNYFKNKKADNFIGRMVSMVKPNAFNGLPNNTTDGNFNNFQQREIDMDDLEKKLLGWDK